MKVIITIGVSWVVLFLTLNAIGIRWLIFHKPAFMGQAIDVDTKKPIEGAVVVAIYSKIDLGIFLGLLGHDYSSFKVKETLTDQNGIFVFPPYTTLIGPLSIGFGSTALFIYKPGYFYGGFPLDQETGLPPKKIEDMDEEWSAIKYPKKKFRFHKGILELPKAETREERIEVLQDFEDLELDFKYPKLAVKLINEEVRFLGLPHDHSARRIYE